jgi:hypothetical protein
MNELVILTAYVLTVGYKEQLVACHTLLSVEVRYRNQIVATVSELLYDAILALVAMTTLGSSQLEQISMRLSLPVGSVTIIEAFDCKLLRISPVTLSHEWPTATVENDIPSSEGNVQLPLTQPRDTALV